MYNDLSMQGDFRMGYSQAVERKTIRLVATLMHGLLLSISLVM